MCAGARLARVGGFDVTAPIPWYLLAAGQQHQGVLAGRYAAGVVPQSRMNRRKAPPVGQWRGLSGPRTRGWPWQGRQSAERRRVAGSVSLARFTERERDRGAVMPGTFRAAVAAEMGQAFSPPYQVPIVVAVNGLLMAGAWFLLPRGWLFTLQSALAFPVVLSSWMYADVPATNVLAPDRIRVLAALGDGTMISRLLLAKTAVLWVFVAPLCAVRAHP